MIPEWVIDEVRQRASIKQLMRSLRGADPVSGGGGSYRYRCPFHSDRTPSMTVSRGRKGRREVFRCFAASCGRKGDQIQFVQELHGLSFPTAVRFLAERLNVTWEEEGRGTAPLESRANGVRAAVAESRPSLKVPRQAEMSELPMEVIRVIEALGHPEKTLREMKPTRWHPYWMYGEQDGEWSKAVKVIWPAAGHRAMMYRLVWFGGTWRLAVGVQNGRYRPAGRDLLMRHAEGDIHLPRRTLALYGCERLEQDGAVVLTEGEKDADAWWRSARRPAVSGHSGGLNAVQRAQLHGRQIVIVGDHDSSGDARVDRQAENLEGVAAEIRRIYGRELVIAAGADPDDPDDSSIAGFDLADALERAPRSVAAVLGAVG